jgi:hypothetical protein
LLRNIDLRPLEPRLGNGDPLRALRVRRQQSLALFFASVTLGPVFIEGDTASMVAPATGLPVRSVTITFLRSAHPSDITIARM